MATRTSTLPVALSRSRRILISGSDSVKLWLGDYFQADKIRTLFNTVARYSKLQLEIPEVYAHHKVPYLI